MLFSFFLFPSISGFPKDGSHRINNDLIYLEIMDMIGIFLGGIIGFFIFILLSPILQPLTETYAKTINSISLWFFRNKDPKDVIFSYSISNDMGWINSEVSKFLSISEIEMFSVDSAVLAYICPGKNGRGIISDEEIDLQVIENQIDTAVPYRIQQICKKNWNSSKIINQYFCVTEYSSSLASDGGKLKLCVRPISEYLLNSVYQALNDPLEGNVIRDEFYFKLFNRNSPLIPNQLIAYISIITGDQKILFKKLENRTGETVLLTSLEEKYIAPQIHVENLINLSNTNCSDFSLFSGLERALERELLLTFREVKETQITILGVGFEYDNFNTTIYAMAQLPEFMTESKIEDKFNQNGKIFPFLICPFNFGYLKYILNDALNSIELNKEKISIFHSCNWHPASRMNIILALRNKYGHQMLQHLIVEMIETNKTNS